MQINDGFLLYLGFSKYFIYTKLDFFPQIKLHFFIIKLHSSYIFVLLHTHAKTVTGILSYGHTCITTFSYNSCHMMPTFGLTCDGLCQAVLVRIRQKCDLWIKLPPIHTISLKWRNTVCFGVFTCNLSFIFRLTHRHTLQPHVLTPQLHPPRSWQAAHTSGHHQIKEMLLSTPASSKSHQQHHGNTK